MKRWTAAILALAWLAPGARAADDLAGAARELGRRTAGAVGNGGVAVTWRNLSSVPPDAVAQARAAFESAVRAGGAAPAAEIQMTVSENASGGLLVEELRRGDDRQVWMASFRKMPGPRASAAIEKRLLWEQEEPILDVAPAGDGLLVLTPEALVGTQPQQRVRITPVKPWPRDLRGRVRVNGAAVHVHLPGMSCAGTWQPALTLSCAPGDEPWTLESGRALLLANFADGRNYFDGRVVTQNAARRTVPPFYTAAAADSTWLLALVDGQTGIFDASLERIGSIPGWGSGIAAADARCGGAAVVLATRPGEGRDAVQAYTVANRAVVPMGEAAEFAGPVTALWPGVAVVRNGTYQAYAISVVCAP